MWTAAADHAKDEGHEEVTEGLNRVSKKPPSSDGENEQDWPLAPASEQPPPGKALVAYRRARIVKRFDRRVVELEFSIIDPTDWKDEKVILYCALPLEGPAKRQGKYYELWTLANGAPPKRKDRMSPGVFAGYWLVELERTRMMTKRDGGVRPAETHEATTVIGRLIERAAPSR